MNTSEQDEERVMQEALQLLDEGKSTPSILETYPTYAIGLQELFDSIQALRAARQVMPSPELLQSTLQKISTPIPSASYMGHFQLRKIGVFVLVVAVLVVGGTTIIGNEFNSNNQQNSQTIAMTNPSDTSDAALVQDTSAIDNQLDGLNSDEAQTDQALNYASTPFNE